MVHREKNNPKFPTSEKIIYGHWLPCGFYSIEKTETEVFIPPEVRGEFLLASLSLSDFIWTCILKGNSAFLCADKESKTNTWSFHLYTRKICTENFLLIIPPTLRDYACPALTPEGFLNSWSTNLICKWFVTLKLSKKAWWGVTLRFLLINQKSIDPDCCLLVGINVFEILIRFNNLWGSSGVETLDLGLSGLEPQTFSLEQKTSSPVSPILKSFSGWFVAI